MNNLNMLANAYNNTQTAVVVGISEGRTMSQMRKYGRSDVEFSTWYSKWSKDLAALHTRDDLERMAGITAHDAKKSAGSHLRAIDATGSMTGNSQRRAQTGNSVRANGERMMAINGALEIHDIFPEMARNSQ